MPLEPTLDELSNQPSWSPAPSPAPPSQGLPPPQPTPSWFSRDVEQQQRWGLPGAGGQLSNLASRAAGGVKAGWNWLDERAQTAMTGGVSEESVRAADDLLAQFMGWGSMTGAERGALGALRMSRMPPGAQKWALTNYGAADEWNLHSKETGKKLGELYTTYHPGSKRLHVDYMTTEHPSWEKYKPDSPIDQRSWGMGTHELQTLGPEVLREYPDIDTLHFSRIGGVFKGRPMSFTYKRVTMPDGSVGFERIAKSEGSGREPWRSPQERQQAREERRQRPLPESAPASTPYVRPANAAPPYPIEPAPSAPTPADRTAAWDRYWQSIGSGNQEETNRLYNEYISLLRGQY